MSKILWAFLGISVVCVVNLLAGLGGSANGGTESVSGSSSVNFSAQNLVLTTSALTPGATVNIDFNGAAIQTLANSTNVTFTESNAGAGKSVTVILTNDSSARTIAIPAWVNIGSTFPTSLAASKVLVFTITHTGSTAGSGYVASAAQP